MRKGTIEAESEGDDILNTQSIFFNTEFIILNTQSIIFITYLEHFHDIVEVLDRLRAQVDSFGLGVVLLDVARISMRAFVVLQNTLKKVSAGGGVGGCVRGGAAA